MAADNWFYAVGQEQKGPLTVDQVTALMRSKVIDGNTYVWNQSLSDWMPVSQTELAPLLTPSFAPAPPPRTPSFAGAPPMATTAAFTAASGQGAVADIQNAVRVCFSKFVTWSGRANRPEFWYFILVCFVLNIAAAIIDAILSLKFGLVRPLVSLALLLPNLAVGVRRLHDTDRSGWWLLLSFIPLVGAIVLIVFWAQPGTRGPNRYGEPEANV